MKPSIDADIIMPVTTPNGCTYNTAAVSIRTCQATTGGRLWVVHNNTEDQSKREQLKEECRLLGVNYVYFEGPFSISYTFNEMFKRTTGKYIAYSSGDVIFFDNWFENIISHFEEHPEYFILSPYSFHIDNPACARQTPVFERRIVKTHNPVGPLLVFRRDNVFTFDENLPFWESDADLIIHMERNKLLGGYCCDARVDHITSSYVQNIDMRKHFGFEGDVHQNFYGKATKYLKEKWNL